MVLEPPRDGESGGCETVAMALAETNHHTVPRGQKTASATAQNAAPLGPKPEVFILKYSDESMDLDSGAARPAPRRLAAGVVATTRRSAKRGGVVGSCAAVCRAAGGCA